MKPLTSVKTYLPLIFILLLHVLGAIVLRPVNPHADDFCYAAHAHNFLHQPFHLTYNKFQNRLGVYLPTAFFFWIFGISANTVSLWPLLASCMTIVAVYFMVYRITDAKIATFSALLIASNTLQITYSIALFPDLIVSFYSILGILLLYAGREAKNNLFHALAFPIVLLAGLFTKETILLSTPFILTIFIIDFIKKEHLHFWKKMLPFAVFCILVFFAFYGIMTGDSLHRLKSMQDFKNNSLITDDDARMLKATFPNNIFLWLNGEMGYVFLLIFSLPAFITLYSIKNKFLFYITLYSLLLFVEYLVLFHHPKYGPVFLQDRIWMLMIAPLSIVAGITVYKTSRTMLYTMMFLFLLYSILNISSVSMTRESLYISLPMMLTLILFFERKFKKNLRLFMALPLVILYLNFVYGNSNYRSMTPSSVNANKNLEMLLNTPDGQ